MIEFVYLLLDAVGSWVLAKWLPENPTTKQLLLAALVLPVTVFGLLSYPRVLINQSVELSTQLFVFVLGYVISYLTLQIQQ